MTRFTLALAALVLAALMWLSRVQVQLGAGMTLHMEAMILLAEGGLVAFAAWLAWRSIKGTGFVLAMVSIRAPGAAT